jgi:hypothetical protein
MSVQHTFVYPTVTQVGPQQPAVTRERPGGPTQRELVLASLLRCPEDRSSARARKGA